jgi:hypothetical protein
MRCEQANVTVTASAADLPGWLWALKPTIERVMIWQARKSGRAFLTFCENRALAYVAEGRSRKVTYPYQNATMADNKQGPKRWNTQHMQSMGSKLASLNLTVSM